MDENEKKVLAAIALSLASENLKTEAAAAFLQVKPATLEQWRWRGNGPLFVKVGRSVIYQKKDLEAYIEARVFRSTTEAQAAA